MPSISPVGFPQPGTGLERSSKSLVYRTSTEPPGNSRRVRPVPRADTSGAQVLVRPVPVEKYAWCPGRGLGVWKTDHDHGVGWMLVRAWALDVWPDEADEEIKASSPTSWDGHWAYGEANGRSRAGVRDGGWALGVCGGSRPGTSRQGGMGTGRMGRLTPSGGRRERGREGFRGPRSGRSGQAPLCGSRGRLIARWSGPETCSGPVRRGS